MAEPSPSPAAEAPVANNSPPAADPVQAEAIPQYVLDYCPLVYLHSKEPFCPSSVKTHLEHCPPSRQASDGVAIENIDPSIKGTFAELALQTVNNEQTYLTSTDDIRKNRNLPWLISDEGRPDKNGKSAVGSVTLIVVDKSNVSPGTVDAFWFYFYSFNLGPKVVGVAWGNHVADWEHSMVRFVNGVPQAAHLSSHADGFAYTYDALEKRGKRPVIYSAIGSHALYPFAGPHPYSPVGYIGPVDQTDDKSIAPWDPLQNFRAFRYRPTEARDDFVAFDPNKDGDFVPCLRYQGKWGDKFSLPALRKPLSGGVGMGPASASKKRAKLLQDLVWVDGITGPRDKNLERTGMNRTSNKISNDIKKPKIPSCFK